MLEGSNATILLDRDGVLNLDRPDSVKTVEELEIERGAVEGCSLLVGAGYRLAVVTNQSAVGRGWMDRSTLDAVNAELDRRLGGVIDAWYICDHAPDAGCRCRKPDTLLLERAQADLAFEPAHTWLVADADRDIEAALRFGCRPAIVRTGKGEATAAAHPTLPAFADLSDFARAITAPETPTTASGQDQL